MKRIGLIGCGVVGHHLGNKILRAGFELRVHDRHEIKAASLRDKGATWAPDPATLGAECDAVISALPRPEDLLEALIAPGGVWSAARPRLLHIDTSTVGIACARTLGDEAASRRIRYLDAPVSVAETRDGVSSLAIFVGGNADYYDLARPLMATLAERVHFFAGPPGTGQVVKLVNNLVSHALTVVLADALAMGLKFGVSIEQLRAALHDGTAQCRLLDELLPASAFRGDWRPGLRLDLTLKDLGLAEDLAVATDVTQHLLSGVRAIYEEAEGKGWGHLSSHAVLRVQEDAAGVSFRSSIFASGARRDDSPRVLDLQDEQVPSEKDQER